MTGDPKAQQSDHLVPVPFLSVVNLGHLKMQTEPTRFISAVSSQVPEKVVSFDPHSMHYC